MDAGSRVDSRSKPKHFNLNSGNQGTGNTKAGRVAFIVFVCLVCAENAEPFSHQTGPIERDRVRRETRGGGESGATYGTEHVHAWRLQSSLRRNTRSLDKQSSQVERQKRSVGRKGAFLG